MSEAAKEIQTVLRQSVPARPVAVAPTETWEDTAKRKDREITELREEVRKWHARAELWKWLFIFLLALVVVAFLTRGNRSQ